MSSPNIHELNQQLEAFLQRIPPGQPFQLTGSEAESLVSALVTNISAAAEQAKRQDLSSPDFAAYRCNLARLKQALPDLQAYLLTEGARLSVKRDHMDRTASWAKTASLTT